MIAQTIIRDDAGRHIATLTITHWDAKLALNTPHGDEIPFKPVRGSYNVIRNADTERDAEAAARMYVSIDHPVYRGDNPYADLVGHLSLVWDANRDFLVWDTGCGTYDAWFTAARALESLPVVPEISGGSQSLPVTCSAPGCNADVSPTLGRTLCHPCYLKRSYLWFSPVDTGMQHGPALDEFAMFHGWIQDQAVQS